MFWRKCGKLMINPDGKLSNCPECPCGYYGLFVLEYYTHAYVDGYPDHAGPRCPGDPEQEWWYQDFCDKSLIVFPAHVVDNELKPYQYAYNAGGMPIGFDRYTCIPVSRQAQPDGTVADDQELEGQYYMPCDYTSNPPVYGKIAYLVHVYRIGDCFDNYDDFAIFFYSGCGVLPDAMTGKFPDIFGTETWDGVWYETVTSNARNCINTNWNTYADKLYRPKIIMHYDMYTFSFNFYPDYQVEPDGVPSGCCDVFGDGPGDDDRCTIAPAGCQLALGTVTEGNIYDESKDRVYQVSGSYYHAIVVTARYGDLPDLQFFTGCMGCNPSVNLGAGGWTFDCDVRWPGMEAALPAMNEWESEALEDMDNYGIVPTSDTGGEHTFTIPLSGYNMCFGDDSNSYHCTRCEAYYGSSGGQRWRQRQYAKMHIEKSDDTPEGATGVVCCLKAWTYKSNDDFSIVKDQTDYLYENEMVTIKFGEEFTLPLCDNMKSAEIGNTYDPDNCLDPDVIPRGWHNNTEDFHFFGAVIRYSYD